MEQCDTSPSDSRVNEPNPWSENTRSKPSCRNLAWGLGGVKHLVLVVQYQAGWEGPAVLQRRRICVRKILETAVACGTTKRVRM